MSTPHNLTRAQIKALRYFAPGHQFKPGDPVPAARTRLRLESLGLTAWRVGAFAGNGRDETTDAGLAILAEIDGRKA